MTKIIHRRHKNNPLIGYSLLYGAQYIGITVGWSDLALLVIFKIGHITGQWPSSIFSSSIPKKWQVLPTSYSQQSFLFQKIKGILKNYLYFFKNLHITFCNF